jgi:predicted nucleic acid-binding protein
MTERILADTTALAHLTKGSPHSAAYNKIVGRKRVVISFQSRPELLSANYNPARRRRLDLLLAATVPAPHSDATDVWYVRIVSVRKQLKAQQRPGSDAGDADVWIIASALEHGIPLMSHDKQQVCLARACGLATYTDLDELREHNP